jgi:hypothetical protein
MSGEQAALEGMLDRFREMLAGDRNGVGLELSWSSAQMTMVFAALDAVKQERDTAREERDATSETRAELQRSYESEVAELRSALDEAGQRVEALTRRAESGETDRDRYARALTAAEQRAEQAKAKAAQLLPFAGPGPYERDDEGFRAPTWQDLRALADHNFGLYAAAQQRIAKLEAFIGGEEPPLPLNELPGMWEQADLIGGETDAYPSAPVATADEEANDVSGQ